MAYNYSNRANVCPIYGKRLFLSRIKSKLFFAIPENFKTVYIRRIFNRYNGKAQSLIYSITRRKRKKEKGRNHIF